MSANNQIIVAPYPNDLKKYAVWYDSCVDNPFDFRKKPLGVFKKLEDAMRRANQECDSNKTGYYVEYGIWFIDRRDVSGYKLVVDDEFPEYEYLAPFSRNLAGT